MRSCMPHIARCSRLFVALSTDGTGDPTASRARLRPPRASWKLSSCQNGRQAVLAPGSLPPEPGPPVTSGHAARAFGRA